MKFHATHLSFSNAGAPSSSPRFKLRAALALRQALRCPLPWRRPIARNLCMVSEQQTGDIPVPSRRAPEYGAASQEYGDASGTSSPTVPSTTPMSPTATTSTKTTTASDGNSTTRLIALGTTVVLCLTLGIAATSTGMLSSEKLMGIAQWFEKQGPNAIYLYGLLYFGFEMIAVPALPLTLGSGYLFGFWNGTVTVSIASTLAATASFLIARYGLRANISRLANRYRRLRVFDRAIGREGFKFVLLLRLSPVLPFALSNYLYGLTSVKMVEYVLASWLGMLPGTMAYVSAGAAVNALTDLRDGRKDISPVVMVLGVLASIAVLLSVGAIAQKAVENVDEEEVG